MVNYTNKLISSWKEDKRRKKESKDKVFGVELGRISLPNLIGKQEEKESHDGPDEQETL